MEATTFYSNLSILVNNILTKDFEVGRGLRHGDLLSAFLFVIIVEGLAGLVRKALEIGEFNGFNIHDSCNVEILQFADDTLLIGERSWKNVWSIKEILRGFKLASSLGVNFHKSRIISLNVRSHFLYVAANFLSCRLESKEFTFFEIPIGINPRRIKSWKFMLEKISSRLSNCKRRVLSLGGRITLIKYVLRSLSIFLLSFYKLRQRYGEKLRKFNTSFCGVRRRLVGKFIGLVGTKFANLFRWAVLE
ncbi:uncharacterized protein LOC131624873 [Vicia villosa]|uniref:uncharacterized protein LOC131624873 n=1 Tax=Vicia villosa TaxID=3911 RepID=UPI00273C5F37|nr:uncharacterized protein LOC131624873 [Vicia villosa]